MSEANPEDSYTPEEVAAITEVVREADQAFETSGGSSRHWVRDQFLPRLEEAGWVLVLGAAFDRRDELEVEIQRLQARDSETTMQARRDANRADANAAECGRLREEFRSHVTHYVKELEKAQALAEEQRRNAVGLFDGAKREQDMRKEAEQKADALRVALESVRKKASEYRVAQGRHMPPSWQTHFDELEDEAAAALAKKPERYLYAEIVKARGTTELVREVEHSDLRDLCDHESRTPFGCRNCEEERNRK